MRVLTLIDLVMRRAEIAVAIVAMSGVVVILTAQVFFRYVLLAPIFFAEEVALVLMIIATFCGLSLLVAEDKLIGIDMLGPYLSERARNRLVLLMRIAIALISGFLAFYAIRYVSTPWVWFERFATLPLPRTALYLVVTVELCLMTFHQAINIIKLASPKTKAIAS